MKLTTERNPTGSYTVFVDGKATDLTIEKGDPPKFGMRQEWLIGVYLRDPDNTSVIIDTDWLVFDQCGKAAALATIAAILQAANPTA